MSCRRIFVGARQMVRAVSAALGVPIATGQKTTIFTGTDVQRAGAAAAVGSGSILPRPRTGIGTPVWEMQSFRRDIPDAEGKRQPESH